MPQESSHHHRGEVRAVSHVKSLNLGTFSIETDATLTVGQRSAKNMVCIDHKGWCEFHNNSPQDQPRPTSSVVNRLRLINPATMGTQFSAQLLWTRVWCKISSQNGTQRHRDPSLHDTELTKANTVAPNGESLHAAPWIRHQPRLPRRRTKPSACTRALQVRIGHSLAE